MAQGRTEALAPAGMRRDKLGQAFCEDAPGAGWRTAEEFARVQVQHDGQAAEWEVSYRASVARMDPSGASTADRTPSGNAFGCGNDNNRSCCWSHTFEPKIFEARKHVREHMNVLGEGNVAGVWLVCSLPRSFASPSVRKTQHGLHMWSPPAGR